MSVCLSWILNIDEYKVTVKRNLARTVLLSVMCDDCFVLKFSAPLLFIFNLSTPLILCC